MASPPPDQRRFTRIPVDLHGVLTDASGTWEVALLDISLKGALVSRPARWEGRCGEQCTLDLQLTEQVGIRMEATVAHLDQHRVGCHCERIDLDSMSHLRRLVEVNLADPALLERDLSALVGRH
jgi:hypothetical protein